jgi:hypothetical protein
MTYMIEIQTAASVIGHTIEMPLLNHLIGSVQQSDLQVLLQKEFLFIHGDILNFRVCFALSLSLLF